MNSFIKLQGYAAPFLKAEKCKGVLEFFDAHAFDEQSAASGNVFLNFGTHDAEPIARPLTLFADDYGLGFSIAVSARHWRSIGTAVMAGCSFCSVFTSDESRAFDRLADGTPAYRITRAKLEHVTICSDPIYKGTGVWPSAFDGTMPPRLKRLRARWLVGWRRHVERGRDRTRSAGSVPPRIAAALAPHAARFREFRNAAAARFRATGIMPVMGHIAFTKSAGFDAAEFMQMIGCGPRQSWRSPGE